VLADLAGGDWPEQARQAAIGLSTTAQDNDPMGSLLLDIMEGFLRLGRERLLTQELTSWLDRVEERPWQALKRGGQVKPMWLAQRLQVYGIRPKTLRVGEARAKGYEFSDFLEAFRRYVPVSEVEAFRREILEERGKAKERVERGESGSAGAC
jgi:hypothetical protein